MVAITVLPAATDAPSVSVNELGYDDADADDVDANDAFDGGGED